MTQCKRCESDLMILCRRVIKNGAIQYVYQCQVCGLPSHPLKHSDVVGSGSLPDFNPDLERHYRELLNQRQQEKSQQDKAEFFEWYDEYLKTPEWRQRRELVMRRAHGICEGCGLANASEVHHMTYENVGEEFLWELFAVCGPCHRRYHDNRNERFYGGAA